MHCPHHATSVHALNASHSADPQDFYRALAARAGLHFDAALQLWVAAEPATVRQLLEHAALGVRPPDEPVPRQLQGSHFGAVFAQWLRMREDAGHAAEKAALAGLLADWSDSAIEGAARRASTIAASGGPRHWQWASLPCSIAALLGLELPDLAAQRGLLAKLAAWAAALKPQADAAALAAADAACAALAPLRAQQLALLWQSYEAGAGLLGNAWLAGSAAQDPTPPIHHTRRFALQELRLLGQTLPRGAPLLLLLVADPALGYGHGRHQCPGRALALRIAALALAHAPARPAAIPPHYLPLPNARVPVLPEQPC